MKTKTISGIVLLIASVLLLMFLAGCHKPAAEAPAPEVEVAPAEEAVPEAEAPPAEEADTYLIGVMMPLTGDGAAYGVPLEQTARIAVEEINAAGGINGKNIKLIVEDSKCNPKDGSTAANKLVNVDKVKYIIGGVCSGETLGAAPVTEAAKVILFSPTSTSPDITTAGDFVFRTAPSDAFAGKIAAETAYERGAMKAAIFSENTDYAQGLHRVFKERFEELGGEIIAEENYNPEETDFRTQALKIKDAAPDAVYLVPQTPAKGVLAAKQLREGGVDVQIYTGEVLLGRDVAKDSAEDLEGVIGFEQYFDETGAKATALLAKFKDAYGDPPFPAFQAGTYDVVNLLAEGIKAHGDDTEAVRDWLYTLKDYDGAVGSLTLDENGDPILTFAKKQILGGEVVDLEE